MNIYFAGSIRGGRADQKLYVAIIDILRGFGEVLTEHIGDAEVFEKEEGVSDAEIFARDVTWLTQSDLVIAEVTTTSLGVGYELGLAEALGKPVLCLYRPSPGKQLSAMLVGNPHLTVALYQEPEELHDIFSNFINTYGK